MKQEKIKTKQIFIRPSVMTNEKKMKIIVIILF